MRKEFLKAYVMSLLAEGRVRASDTPTKILASVLLCIKEDFPEVATDIASIYAQHGLMAVGAFIQDKLTGMASWLGRPGAFADIMNGVKQQHNRGLDTLVQTKSSKRR